MPPAPAITVKAASPGSLRGQLLRWLLGPLLVLVALNTFSVYRNALDAADVAYDRSLLASTRALAERVSIVGGPVLAAARPRGHRRDPGAGVHAGAVAQQPAGCRLRRDAGRRQGASRAAGDGRPALEAALQDKPSAVFLDIGMPEMDGPAVLRALRAQPGGAAIFVTAVTGYGAEDERAERPDFSGFDARLLKPVALADLQELLANVRLA